MFMIVVIHCRKTQILQEKHKCSGYIRTLTSRHWSYNKSHKFIFVTSKHIVITKINQLNVKTLSGLQTKLDRIKKTYKKDHHNFITVSKNINICIIILVSESIPSVWLFEVVPMQKRKIFFGV